MVIFFIANSNKLLIFECIKNYNMGEYKDYMGNKLYPKFYLGGFNNEITICGLYVERKHLPKWLPDFIRLKRVFWSVTTDNLEKVNKWGEEDFKSLILDTIYSYSNSHNVVSNKLKNINKKYFK